MEVTSDVREIQQGRGQSLEKRGLGLFQIVWAEKAFLGAFGQRCGREHFRKGGEGPASVGAAQG